MAGGVNPTASLHHAQIIRKSENGPIQVPVNIKEILAGKAPDVTLQAGDVLFVPNAAVAVKLHKEYFYDVPHLTYKARSIAGNDFPVKAFRMPFAAVLCQF